MDSCEKAVLKVLKDEYNIEATKLELKKGRIDRTYIIDDNKCVMKVFMDPLAQDQQRIEAEIELIRFLDQNGLPVAKIVPTKTGRFFAESLVLDEAKQTETKRYFRLQSFLQGITSEKMPLTDGFSFAIGATVGKLLSIMATFQHPHYYEVSRPHNSIILSEAYDIFKVRQVVAGDEKKMAICSAVLSSYEDNFTKRIDELPKQIIHGDLHLVNIMADEQSGGIVGVFDFMDACFSPRINEIAVPLMRIIGMDDPKTYNRTRAFMRGISSESIKLSEVELKALLPSALGRGVLVLLLAVNWPPGLAYDEAFLMAVNGPVWIRADEILNGDGNLQRLEAALRDN